MRARGFIHFAIAIDPELIFVPSGTITAKSHRSVSPPLQGR